jgi:hypothetical protein
MSQLKILTPSLLVVSAEADAAELKPLPPVPTESWVAVRKLKEQNPMVDYRPYPRLPRYVVGSDGSAWSVFCRDRNGIHVRSRIRRMAAFRSRYLEYKMGDGQKRFCVRGHVMVLETFVGPRPAGHQAAHNDGTTDNNAVSNLRWATPKANARDKEGHGTVRRGEAHGRAKLTEKDVERVFSLHAGGLGYRKIGAILGVTNLAIRQIIKGRNWKSFQQVHHDPKAARALGLIQ